MAGRDKDWDKHPVYMVLPDSSPGPCTYEEANKIYPMSREIYDLLFKDRVYYCAESDLLPESMEPTSEATPTH